MAKTPSTSPSTRTSFASRVSSLLTDEMFDRAHLTGEMFDRAHTKGSHVSLRFPAKEQEIAKDAGPLTRLVFHPRFETFGGFVVLFNFVIMTLETHAAATTDDTVLSFVAHANRLLLIYYTGELIIRMYVVWRAFLSSKWNILDLTIVVTGWIGEVLEIFDVDSGMQQITMLKTLRMLRLLRLLLLFVAFHELHVLVEGISRCIKTLFWAPGLIFVILNVWAILSVELLDQRVKDLLPSGVYRTCDWCDTAFSNIWYANLTWFQIISTADWAAIGRPLVEEYWWPYAFFVLNVFIVIWGLLNLIVAGIVDAHIRGREDNIAMGAQFAQEAYKEAWLRFEAICRNIDSDGSGDISVEEFKCFFEDNDELKQYLTVMGIKAEDVYSLLTLMDVNGDGILQFEELIDQMCIMRTLVEKTSLYFLLKRSEIIEDKLVQHIQEIQHFHEVLSEVKSSRVRDKTARDSYTMLSDSIYSQTSDIGSAGRPAAMGTIAHTPRTITQSETLLSGWYYFGASLPPEASAWCKAVDVKGEFANNLRAFDYPKEVPITTDGKNWQPILSNSLPVVRAPKLRTPPQSPRQDVGGLERRLGMPTSEHPSLEHERHVKFEGEVPCEYSHLLEPSKVQAGATSVKILQPPRTPSESLRQGAIGKPTSDRPSFEHAQHVNFKSPRQSVLINEIRHISSLQTECGNRRD